MSTIYTPTDIISAIKAGNPIPTLFPESRDRNDTSIPEPVERRWFEGMTIKGFARSGRTIRIRSAILGEDVLLAADNAVVDRTDLIVYRAQELRYLTKDTPEDLRLYHEVKRHFLDVTVREEPTDERS